MEVMPFLQYSAVAIRDLGIYNLEHWSGGFEELYKEIFSSMFDEKRNLHSFLVPVANELAEESTCGADTKMLAAAIARVGATYAFVNIAMKRRLNEMDT